MLSSMATYNDSYHNGIDGAMSLVMSRSARRGPWLPEEDQALLQLVRTQGANNWVRISQQVQHRSPKQCRERYHQNLKPSLKHDPISAQEGEVIERLVQEMGKRWAEIARRLGNRSDNAVKNWWNGSVNRRRRNPAQTTTGFKQVGSRIQPLPFTLPATNNHTQSAHLTFNSSNNICASPYESRRDTNRPQRPSALQIPSPVHTRTSSLSGPSPNISYESRGLDTSRPVSNVGPDPNNVRPTLSKVNTTEFRPELPPLRSSSFHLHHSERPISTMERPPISPALSDTSQRQAPSLVSDNQSMYSISPRTVTTPRPGLPATMEVGGSTWLDAQTTQYHHPNTVHKPSYHVDSYSKYTTHAPLDPNIHRISISSLQSIPHDERSKDTRMNVSTLLQ